MRATAKVLHGRALPSIRAAIAAFNSPFTTTRGRRAVVLHTGHTFEMLGLTLVRPGRGESLRRVRMVQ